jgi:hypothetical protein
MSTNAPSYDFHQLRPTAYPASGAWEGVSAAVALLMGYPTHATHVRWVLRLIAYITLDAFEAEFRLLNTGLAPINVPVWPHLSDLQPSSESQPFSYLSLALEVRLSGTGPAQASGVGWVELYGSTQREDTIITLKPGEWVRVKAKVKLHTWPTKPIEAQLRGDFWFHDNVFKPQIGGAFTEAVNVYPNHTLYPAVAVHFSPTHRKTVAVVIRRTLEKLLPSKPAQEESRLRDALQTTFSDKNPDARISARPGPDGGSQRRYVPTAIVNESTVERAARQP